jgi:xylulokinase
VKLIPAGESAVEQDIEEIWSATLGAIGQLPREHLSRVAAIGISSQGGAMQIVTRDYKPVGPVLSWLDGRGNAEGAKLAAEVGSSWLARHTGYGRSGLAVGQILRIAKESPLLLDEHHRVGFVGDVIVRRLCGRGAHDATSLALALMYNPWQDRADAELLQRLNLREDQLPDLIGAKQSTGGLTAAVAAQTHLPAGIPVSAAVHDQYAAALGCGAVHAGDMMFGAGTAWVLLAITDQLAEPVIADAFVCRHPVEGLYGQMLSMGNGGSALSWAMGLLNLGPKSVAEVDAILRRVAPGSDGLRFWPFMASYGSAGLGEVTTRLLHLRFSHTAAHVVRSVVEGLSLELGRYLRLFGGSAVAVRRLIMCGGAASSEVTPQIIADVTRLPVSCTQHSEMSALGAAVIARGLVEPAPLRELSEAMTPPVRSVSPGPGATFYTKLLQEHVDSLPLKGR